MEDKGQHLQRNTEVTWYNIMHRKLSTRSSHSSNPTLHKALAKIKCQQINSSYPVGLNLIAYLHEHTKKTWTDINKM